MEVFPIESHRTNPQVLDAIPVNEWLFDLELGVAVFLDATVIRLAVGPALVALAGRWNWWPGR